LIFSSDLLRRRRPFVINLLISDLSPFILLNFSTSRRQSSATKSLGTNTT
jgi:hypothetical protein